MEGKVGASRSTCTPLIKWKVTSATGKQATTFLHADVNWLSPLLSVYTPLTPSAWMCWLLREGIKLSVQKTHARDKTAQPHLCVC